MSKNLSTLAGKSGLRVCRNVLIFFFAYVDCIRIKVRMFRNRLQIPYSMFKAMSEVISACPQVAKKVNKYIGAVLTNVSSYV